MSYLNVPRLHFSGRFQADPSTVNNNDNNWDPTITFTEASPTYLPGYPDNDQLYNNSVYWNPSGTHNWAFLDCTVKGAANDQGAFSAPSADPIIGAKVESVGAYPAKIVDLDPDNQGVSQIWGLKVRVGIMDPHNPGTVLASVTGTMPETAFCDLWDRTTNTQIVNNGTMSASFQALLVDVVWENAAASPLLAALQSASSSGQLSIRFTVDSFQSDANQSNFTYGRVVGTIGPVLAGEAPRSAPRRLAPAQFRPMAPPPSIFSTYGAANAAWDARRGVVILDLGNTVPTLGPVDSSVTVPSAGWPIRDTTFQLTIPGPSVSPIHDNVRVKAGAALLVGAPSVVGDASVSASSYETFAGVVEIAAAPSLAPLIDRQALTLTDVTQPSALAVAVKEDVLGRYVDVDQPVFRLNPGETANVTLWATEFGVPWAEAALDVAVQAPAAANNPGPPQPPPNQPPPVAGDDYATWQTGTPSNVVTLSASTVVTDQNGTGILSLTAGDPGYPRQYRDGRPGPGGQVYFVTGAWQSYGQIYLFSGAPINLLVFSKYPMPARPTWDADVGPILSLYARLYPYMKGIIDLSDYSTVVDNQAAIQKVLNLPRADPHHMPVVRDLDASRLAIINQWFESGTPKS